MIQAKRCTQCGEEKSADSFYANPRHSTGLSSWCRVCTRNRVKARKLAEPEKVRAEKSRYYERNKDRLIAQQMERRRVNGVYARDYRRTVELIGRERYREECRKRSARYRERHREQVNARALARRNRFREREIERNRQYKEANREEMNRRRRERYRDREQEMRAMAARRRALKLQRTPPWANQDAIERKYEEAALLTRRTGEMFEVDHHVPLVSDIVCGLHWESNLEVLPSELNRAKSNLWWRDMP